jgi:hypothetical protein
MGQATAAAATVCTRRACEPDALGQDGIEAVQQLLLKQDCYIPELLNDDPADLARAAEVTATSASALCLPGGDRWLELAFPTMQILPLTAGRLDTVELLLQNNGRSPVELRLTLRARNDIWDLSEGEPAAEARASLEPGAPRWVRFELGARVPGGTYGLGLDTCANVRWAQHAVPPPGTAVATSRPSGFRRYEGQRGKWTAQAVRLTPESRPFEPENVTNGVARPERLPNIWISEKGLPQSLTIRLAGEEDVGEVRLTFDNNLGRNVRSTPPLFVAPELVRDYRVELCVGDEWISAFEEQENRRRHRVHRFAPRTASAVRVTVLAAACDQARIYEVRVYGA